MPAEVHEHFTLDTPGEPASGVLTGYTVITRESEWDDETRDRVLGLTEYENGLCGCGCGRPLAESMDNKTFYRVHKVTCYAARAVERIRRHDAAEAEKHEDAEGWDDGVHYYPVPADADDPEVKEVIERGRRAHRARSSQG
jgi:hypothetical protein